MNLQSTLIGEDIINGFSLTTFYENCLTPFRLQKDSWRKIKVLVETETWGQDSYISQILVRGGDLVYNGHKFNLFLWRRLQSNEGRQSFNSIVPLKPSCSVTVYYLLRLFTCLDGMDLKLNGQMCMYVRVRWEPVTCRHTSGPSRRGVERDPR